MENYSAALLTAWLVLLAVAPSSSGHEETSVWRHRRAIDDGKLDPANSDKMVQQLEMELATKKEENQQNILKVQDLEGKLKVANQHVEQLIEQGKLLNSTVETLSQENKDLKLQLADKDSQVRELSKKLNESLHKLEVFSDDELHLQNILNDYYKDQDWRALRRGLESVLDRSGEEYRQLQSISYEHGYPLWKVGSMCSVALAAVLVSGSRGPNISESDGDTLLHGACEGACVQIINMTLDQGADVDVRDNGGATPINIAARYGRLNVVKLLKERGADLNSADKNDMTSLHLAAEGGHLEVVKYLVEAGEEVATKDTNGLSPLDRARVRGRAAVVQYLSQLDIYKSLPTSTPTPESSPNSDESSIPTGEGLLESRLRRFRHFRHFRAAVVDHDTCHVSGVRVKYPRAWFSNCPR